MTVVCSKMTVTKFIYNCLIIINFFLAFYVSFNAFLSWEEAPVVISSTNKNVREIPFPAVSVCQPLDWIWPTVIESWIDEDTNFEANKLLGDDTETESSPMVTLFVDVLKESLWKIRKSSINDLEELLEIIGGEKLKGDNLKERIEENFETNQLEQWAVILMSLKGYEEPDRVIYIKKWILERYFYQKRLKTFSKKEFVDKLEVRTEFVDLMEKAILANGTILEALCLDQPWPISNWCADCVASISIFLA